MPHEGKSLGDYAIDMTVNEIPMGKRVTELMLCFGSPLAGFGMAVVRTKNVVQSQVVFTPQEVSTSVQALIIKYPLGCSLGSVETSDDVSANSSKIGTTGTFRGHTWDRPSISKIECISKGSVG